MGNMVYSLLWVMQDLSHQPYVVVVASPAVFLVVIVTVVAVVVVVAAVVLVVVMVVATRAAVVAPGDSGRGGRGSRRNYCSLSEIYLLFRRVFPTSHASEASSFFRTKSLQL